MYGEGRKGCMEGTGGEGMEERNSEQDKIRREEGDSDKDRNKEDQGVL